MEAPAHSSVAPASNGVQRLQAARYANHAHGGLEYIVDPRLDHLRQVLTRWDVTIAQPEEALALSDYDLVVIADDSGSMTTESSSAQMGMAPKSRWDELKETLGLIVDMGGVFDSTGIDVFFLNRGPVQGIRGSSDASLQRALAAPPQGSTPLTETLQTVVRQWRGDKPVLLFILTDGVPNGGVCRFIDELRRSVRRSQWRVQIMACTEDDNAVGWLNDVDKELAEVDVTDDYYTEMVQVLKDARTTKKFTRGDWCMKAMLGSISSRLDRLDERGDWMRPMRMLQRGNTAKLESLAACSSADLGCVVS